MSAMDTDMLNPKPRHRQVDLPPTGPKVIPLKRLGANDRLRVIVAATKFYGMYVHWSGRSRPHTEPRERCDGCKHENAIKWYGWLHCVSLETLASFFIEFTALAAEYALKQMGGAVERGAMLHLMREAGKLRASIVADKIGVYDGLRGELPQPANPSATLTKLWNTMVILQD